MQGGDVPPETWVEVLAKKCNSKIMNEVQVIPNGRLTKPMAIRQCRLMTRVKRASDTEIVYLKKGDINLA